MTLIVKLEFGPLRIQMLSYFCPFAVGSDCSGSVLDVLGSQFAYLESWMFIFFLKIWIWMFWSDILIYCGTDHRMIVIYVLLSFLLVLH